MMEANQCFIKIVQIGSILKASLELELTQSTVRKKIAILEKYLKSSLLIPTRNGCTPTEEGLRYYKMILPSIETIESHMQSFMHNAPEDEKIKYKIFSTLDSALFFTNHLMPDIVKKFPQYLIDMQICSINYSKTFGSHYKNMINDSELLFLNPSLINLIHPDEWKYAYEYKGPYMKLFSSPKYLAKVGPVTTLSDLQGLNFISRRSEGTENGILTLYNEETKKNASCSLSTVSIVELDQLKLAQIKKGIGVGLLWSDGDITKHDLNGLIEILPNYRSDLSIDVMFLTKKNHPEITNYIIKKARDIVANNSIGKIL